MTTLLHVVGARPNFVKLGPVIDAVTRVAPEVRQVLVHTGQHYDATMSDLPMRELGLPDPDHHLAVGSGSIAAQTARALERLEPVLLTERPDAIVVAGDVNSTLAAALAAAQLQIPIAHVEAGLRSFDRTMPEEVNRVLVDQLSSWCFTHSPEAEEHLLREGIDGRRIHFIGNTMIDSLVRLRTAIDGCDVHQRMGVKPGAYGVVTLHRPRLVDDRELFARTIEALVRLSRKLPLIFPMHPRARARLDADPGVLGLSLVEPVGYIDSLALQAGARLVITDSGGVQEETTYLGVPCFTLRENTERPVTVSQGTNRLLGLDVDRLDGVLELAADEAPGGLPLAGWDGRASQRLVDILLTSLREIDAGAGGRSLTGDATRIPSRT